MDSYDSTVKLAHAVAVGDALVGVDRDGEHLFEVIEVRHEPGKVTIVTRTETVTLAPRDAVRVAHPDLSLPDPARSTMPTGTT